ncbi:MAG: DNA polymerase IV [Micromonosporaceae bacterium]
MGRWVVHVDLDQFIAAVEMLRRPELVGRPVVVGGDGDPTKRGVVSTASYVAREYGVHSGLPLRTAARRCPDAVFLPVDAEAYEAASAQVTAVLRTLDAVVEPMGWDEWFLGVDTDDPEAFARELQRRVKQATRLECSAGIGENKLQAKLATGFGKPAGVARLTHASWYETFGDRPTDALWGIGAKTAKRLAGLGIRTVKELAATDPEVLAAQVGPATGPWLVNLGRGGTPSVVTDKPYVPRGHSRERTYQRDLADWEEVRRELAVLAREVVDGNQRPVTRLIVKVRYVPFTTVTHSRKLPVPTVDPAAIAEAADDVLELFTRRRPVRLLGIRVEFTREDTPRAREDTA